MLIILFVGGCFNPSKTDIPHIIFDTDIGGDIDDLGALYLLHKYADAGQCDILAVMTSWSMAYHVDGVDAVNTWFNRPGIPIGVYADSLYEKEEYTWFLGQNYPHKITGRTAPKAAKLYRKILASQPDTSVSVVVTGRLNNLYDLFQTKPDQFSALNGLELAEKKVKTYYIMGGRYPVGSKSEANFRNGGFKSKFVIDHITRPIVFNGGEIGSKENGYVLGKALNKLPDENILKHGYSCFFEYPPNWTGLVSNNFIQDWSIWDLITVQVAVTGVNDYFDIVSTGYNSLDSTGLNLWVNHPDKNHSYLVKMMEPGYYSNNVILKKIMEKGKYRGE